MSSAGGRGGSGSAAGSGQEHTSDQQYTAGGEAGGQPPGSYQESGQYSAGQERYQQPGQGTYQQAGRGGMGTATYQQQAGYQQQGGYQQQPAGYYERGGYPGDDERHEAAAKVGARLAGVLMIISGIFGFVVGLGVLLRGAFYGVTGRYAYAWNHTGWGLTELILGCVLLAAGFCLLLGMLWARIVGIVIAAFNAIAAFMFLPRSPVSSIVLIALNLFIIWAIVHYHQRSLMRI